MLIFENFKWDFWVSIFNRKLGDKITYKNTSLLKFISVIELKRVTVPLNVSGKIDGTINVVLRVFLRVHTVICKRSLSIN